MGLARFSTGLVDLYIMDHELVSSSLCLHQSSNKYFQQLGEVRDWEDS